MKKIFIIDLNIFLAICEVIERLPEKSVNCRCPDGYITDLEGRCVTLPPIAFGCETDDDCNSTTACVNRFCKDPCSCGLNAECVIVNQVRDSTKLKTLFFYFFSTANKKLNVFTPFSKQTFNFEPKFLGHCHHL